MTTPCTCDEHAAGAPIEVGEHRYALDTDDDTAAGRRWRWRCGCPSGWGRWQYQSPDAAYHAWRRHAGLTGG